MLEGVGQGKVSVELVLTFVHIRGMQVVSYSEARKNLKAMIDKVVADRAPLAIIHKRGREGAVLISASEWESIEEKLYLLSSRANAKRLMEGSARLDTDESDKHELL